MILLIIFIISILKTGRYRDSHVLRVVSDIVLSGASLLRKCCGKSSNCSLSIFLTSRSKRIEELAELWRNVCLSETVWRIPANTVMQCQRLNWRGQCRWCIARVRMSGSTSICLNMIQWSCLLKCSLVPSYTSSIRKKIVYSGLCRLLAPSTAKPCRVQTRI